MGIKWLGLSAQFHFRLLSGIRIYHFAKPIRIVIRFLQKRAFLSFGENAVYSDAKPSTVHIFYKMRSLSKKFTVNYWRKATAS